LTLFYSVFAERDATYSWIQCSQVQMPQTAPVGLRTGSGQRPKTWNWSHNVMSLALDALDLIIAGVTGVVAVAVFFPIYVVVALGKAIVNWAAPSRASRRALG
jgi:hypothetical protein